MKKTWKKVISLLLSMLMLFGIMPLSIYASADSKIEADLREDLAEMEMDDEIVIWIWLKSKTPAEINQMLLEETGMDADLYKNGKVSYDPDEYLAARRAIVKRECSAIVEQFKEKYLQDRLVVYSGMYTTTIVAEVMKEDVLTFSTRPEVSSMSSYKSDPVDVDPANDNLIMDAERDAALREDYLEIVNDPIMDPEDVMVEYYGTYQGYDIVWVSMIDQGDTADIREIRLGNYSFVFYAGSASERFFAYKDHQFIPIKEAYEEGWIDDKDVREIARYFTDAYRVSGTEYYSVLKEPLEQKLKTVYLEMRKEKEQNASYIQNLTIDDVYISNYCGQHNGWEVFEAYTSEDVFPAAPQIVSVAGYVFTFHNGIGNFMAWQEGTLLTVQKAYESDILSQEDILNIGVRRGDIPSKSSLKYEDVDWNKDWFADYAYLGYAKGLMTGLDETTFGPYEIVSRAQFATILSRMDRMNEYSYEEPFEDVQEDDWYFFAVTWAYRNGVINGYNENSFGPSDPITREQMALMMYRYANYLGKDTDTKADIRVFSDVENVSGFASDALKWANGMGIITGKENGTKLDPQGNTARCEAAAIIQRYMNAYAQ